MRVRRQNVVTVRESSKVWKELANCSGGDWKDMFHLRGKGRLLAVQVYGPGMQVQYDTAGVSEQDFDVVVPAKKMLPLIDLESPLKIVVKDDKVFLRAGRSSYKVNTSLAIPPAVVTGEQTDLCSVVKDHLVTALQLGSKCASTKDDYPPYRGGVLLSVTDILRVCSTDSKRLATVTTPIVTVSKGDVLIPVKAARNVASLLAVIPDIEHVTLAVTDTTLVIYAFGLRITVMKINAAYPNVKPLFDKPREQSETMSKSDAVGALKRLNAFADSRVVLRPSHMVALAADGLAIERLECDSVKEVSFEYSYPLLIAGVDSVASKDFTWHTEKSTGALTIESGDDPLSHKYILMPIETSPERMAAIKSQWEEVLSGGHS